MSKTQNIILIGAGVGSETMERLATRLNGRELTVIIKDEVNDLSRTQPIDLVIEARPGVNPIFENSKRSKYKGRRALERGWKR